MVLKKVSDEDDDDDDDTSIGTSSSDSYSYLLRDVENPNNHINEEWEAIERTLYQENGTHVTDPALLKECKLWREAFPHLRVRGTAVNTTEEEKESEADAKGVQATTTHHLALSALDEKRQKIKDSVVSQIVDRLVTKLNLNAGNSANDKEFAPLTTEKSNLKAENKSEKESYFERGKVPHVSNNELNWEEHLTRMTASSTGKDMLSTFFEDFQYNPGTGRRRPMENACSYREGNSNGHEQKNNGKERISNLVKNEEILRSGNLKLKVHEKSVSARGRSDKPADSLSNIVKPFEMTKKIDKKYEAILGKILDNNGIHKVPNDRWKSAKPDLSTVYNDPFQRIRLGVGQDVHSDRKSRELPKLNNFTNNWLFRAERNSYNALEMCESMTRVLHSNEDCDSGRGSKVIGKTVRSRAKSKTSRSANDPFLCDEKLLEDLKREMWNERMCEGRGHTNETNLRWLQLHNKANQNYTANTQKSYSCGDLQRKTSKSHQRVLKSGVGSGKNDAGTKKVVKKKVGKNSSGQNVQLPPIETSIICTEITGRPKHITRTVPKKYV